MGDFADMCLEQEMYGEGLFDDELDPAGPETLLPSQIQNERTIRKIEKAAAKRFPRKQRQIFYEHGHYWMRLINVNSDHEDLTFDVVDAKPGIANTGFDFEEVG